MTGSENILRKKTETIYSELPDVPFLKTILLQVKFLGLNVRTCMVLWHPQRHPRPDDIEDPQETTE